MTVLAYCSIPHEWHVPVVGLATLFGPRSAEHGAHLVPEDIFCTLPVSEVMHDWHTAMGRV